MTHAHDIRWSSMGDCMVFCDNAGAEHVLLAQAR